MTVFYSLVKLHSKFGNVIKILYLNNYLKKTKKQGTLTIFFVLNTLSLTPLLGTMRKSET